MIETPPIRKFTPQERIAFAEVTKEKESFLCPVCGLNRASKEHRRRKCKPPRNINASR